MKQMKKLATKVDLEGLRDAWSVFDRLGTKIGEAIGNGIDRIFEELEKSKEENGGQTV